MSNQNGTLYVIATPIGNLDDLSPRAAGILRCVRYVAVEDSRHSRKLFEHIQARPKVITSHKFNEEKSAQKILGILTAGDDVAVISDAGTPLISDPGFTLVNLCRKTGIRIVPVPGPSALVCALSVAGLPANRFVFEGFLPEKRAARKKRLEVLRYEDRTIVFYEAPHRIREFLADLDVIMGNRRVVIARELTKVYETVCIGTPAELIAWMDVDTNQQKGEFVVILDGISPEDVPAEHDTERLMQMLLEELPINRAAAVVARITGGDRKAIYRLGLAIQKRK